MPASEAPISTFFRRGCVHLHAWRNLTTILCFVTGTMPNSNAVMDGLSFWKKNPFLSCYVCVCNVTVRTFFRNHSCMPVWKYHHKSVYSCPLTHPDFCYIEARSIESSQGALKVLRESGISSNLCRGSKKLSYRLLWLANQKATQQSLVFEFSNS